MNNFITIIGGGLAGCEAAYQIAKRGINVKLYEMKPEKYSGAHSNKNLAEIVCSNSFKSNLITNACGLLKQELRSLDSLLIKIADETKVPAGQALAVDREKFAKKVTQTIENMPNIQIIRKEFGAEKIEVEDEQALKIKEKNIKEKHDPQNEKILEIAKEGIVIIATGPLTSSSLAKQIGDITGNKQLFFYDAAAPIIEKESINMNIAFWGDRYSQERDLSETIDKWQNRIKDIEENYLNLPMNKQEYEIFVNELVNAEIVELHNFEKREIFEGCMPIEIMAKRGIDTLRFGPLKPVGFTDPRTGKRPYAVVQLRQDNAEGNLFNLVGFQTNLKFGEQKRVFSHIPGLENAEFVKYGVMHRNTYINSPQLLDETYSLKTNKNIYFAGQISGVEGYVESISSGMVAALNAINQFEGKKEKIIFSEQTMIGALVKYITQENKNFQPMNANFGILPKLNENMKIKDKKLRYEGLAKRAIEELKKIINCC